MWLKINNRKGTPFVFGKLADFADKKLRRLSLLLNAKVERMAIRQRKAVLIVSLFALSIAGVVCAIPGIHILPVSGMLPLQSAPPPVFPSESLADARYSKNDSLLASGFRNILDSMRRTEQGRKEIEFFEADNPGLLDSMLLISNSLYPKK